MIISKWSHLLFYTTESSLSWDFINWKDEIEKANYQKLSPKYVNI